MAAKALRKTVTKARDEETEEVEANPEYRNAMVPSKKHFSTYFGRSFDKMTDMEVFDFASKKHYNVLLEGPTGSAKTSAIMAYAAMKEVPFYAISSNIGIEPSQLFGKYIPDGEGSFEWVDGPVTEIVRHGGVLLINEVNFMPERVSTVLFGLLDKRRQIELLDHKGEKIEAHENTVVFADMNPDYAGTRPLNAAFRNRFAIQLVWDYDRSVEEHLVACVPLLDLAEKIRERTAQGEFLTPLSTNMLIEFMDTMFDTESLAFATMVLVNHFASEERESVKMLIDTIGDELQTFLDDGSRYPEGHPIWDEREKAMEEYKETGSSDYYDPEWKVVGVDWVL